jgi:hypothetical protein
MPNSSVEFRMPGLSTHTALSLILCSRNDEYMGNSLWRLQTTLNYAAKQVHDLARESQVEVLVADWGSDIPLREVLELSSAAARIVSFIEIAPEVAQDLQKDSPFTEVFALNAAARRADGDYIGRIDQDTLVGKRFLDYFFDLYDGRQNLEFPLNSALMYANQRMVPYRFCVRCPPLATVEKYIDSFWRSLKIEVKPGETFYKHGVGIWLVHRDLWNACGGYDERMIYMNAMEINMINRLKMENDEVVNLGKLVNFDFYHLEHYHPLAFRSSSTHRKVNRVAVFLKPELLNPNGPDWGLIKYPLKKLPYSRVSINYETEKPIKWLDFWELLFVTGVQIAIDKLVKPFWIGYIIWKRRVHVAWGTIHGKPLGRWPKLLAALWVSKKAIKNG